MGQGWRQPTPDATVFGQNGAALVVPDDSCSELTTLSLLPACLGLILAEK